MKDPSALTRLVVVMSWVALLVAAALGVAPLVPPAPPAELDTAAFSVTRALDHIEHIAQEPRPIGSPANQRARAYIVAQLKMLGLEPEVQTIKATDYCDLYRLDKETFDRVIGRHPEFAERIQELAESRRAELEATKTERVPVPAAVEGISATRVETGVRLQWREAEGSVRYEVIRFVQHTGKWRYLTREATEATALDETAEPETSSTYRIRAVNASGPGPWSRPIVVRRVGPDEEQSLGDDG